MWRAAHARQATAHIERERAWLASTVALFVPGCRGVHARPTLPVASIREFGRERVGCSRLHEHLERLHEHLEHFHEHLERLHEHLEV